MHPVPDILVIGAGPAGTVSALLHADRGARVLLAEATPAAANRFAGEWLHPMGTDVLTELGLDTATLGASPGAGFVVLPDDGGEPVELPYAPDRAGLSMEHAELVAALRERAAAHPRIDYRPGTRVTAIHRQSATIADVHGSRTLPCARVIGAGGRASVARRHLGEHDAGQRLSSMGGLVLRGLELPREGFGHVILGGPGPILLYRIGPDAVRISIDLPMHQAALRKDPNRLWEAVRPVLPDAVAAHLRTALSREKIQWAATRFRPRTAYGRGNVALVGDAVGIFHPLTAAGMSMGFADARCLADAPSTAAYRRRRERASHVPELLSNALYRVFTDGDDQARSLRAAVYDVWRKQPAERDRTMAILGGDDTDGTSFATAFTKVGLRAARRGSGPTWARLAELAPWGIWPAMGLARGPVRRALRLRSTSSHPAGGNAAAPTATPAPAAAGDDWAFCKEALGEVSRTFARPIELLPDGLEEAVTCGYLLCRIADTVEDHPALTLAQRDERFELFLGALGGTDPHAFMAAMEAIVGDDAELALARRLDRVLNVFDALPGEVRAICRRWVAEMTRGMWLYSHRQAGTDGLTALVTEQDLDRYCYFVAGTVGHLLTELFLATRPDIPAADETTMRTHAEAFGTGLQLVNIIKDITDDRARGWSFVPRTAARRAGLELSELLEPEHRSRAHRAVAPLIEHARRSLDEALDYTLAIPASETGMRLFCLLPMWMAARTLVLAEGNDALFTPGAAVKIERTEVETLIADCLSLSGDDAALRRAYAGLWTPAAAPLKAAR